MCMKQHSSCLSMIFSGQDLSVQIRKKSKIKDLTYTGVAASIALMIMCCCIVHVKIYLLGVTKVSQTSINFLKEVGHD